MDKQNVGYSYNGVLFSHTKKWSTDTCYNMDEPPKPYAKWKPDKKRSHTVWLNNTSCLEKANL